MMQRKLMPRAGRALSVLLLASAGLEQGMPQVPQKEAKQFSAGHELQGSKTEPPSNAPAIPVDEIIRQFAAKEAEFKKARDNYTYTQLVRIQEYDLDGRRGGEFHRTSERSEERRVGKECRSRWSPDH